MPSIKCLVVYIIPLFLMINISLRMSCAHNTGTGIRLAVLELIHLNRWTNVQRGVNRLIFKCFVANDPIRNKNIT
jgi:hypothetical protein